MAMLFNIRTHLFTLCILFSPFLFAAEDKAKSNVFIAKLITQQIDKNIALDKSVRAILIRYPQEVDSVLTTAFNLYPSRFEEIIRGAISANPVLSCNTLNIALQANIAELDQLIRFVVSAEPAYAQEIVNTALEHHPDKTIEIVRTAIEVDPIVADSIVLGTMKAHPRFYADVLAGAIAALPANTIHYLELAFKEFPLSKQLSFDVAFKENDSEYAHELMAIADRHGLIMKK